MAKSKDPVVSDTKIRILPEHDIATCPPVDILLVGGGVDPSPEMQDDAVVSWFRETGQSAEYVTSVCTGALILAEAGLLDGYKATTHWAYKQQLAKYPEVEVAEGRVVSDRNRITGGGVTAGIDFAFTLISQLVGPDVAAGQVVTSQGHSREARRDKLQAASTSRPPGRTCVPAPGGAERVARRPARCGPDPARVDRWRVTLGWCGSHTCSG